jgi:hypothetical protein
VRPWQTWSIILASYVRMQVDRAWRVGARDNMLLTTSREEAQRCSSCCFTTLHLSQLGRSGVACRRCRTCKCTHALIKSTASVPMRLGRADENSLARSFFFSFTLFFFKFHARLLKFHARLAGLASAICIYFLLLLTSFQRKK